jgi:hypothetical protein
MGCRHVSCCVLSKILIKKKKYNIINIYIYDISDESWFMVGMALLFGKLNPSIQIPSKTTWGRGWGFEISYPA